MQEQNRILSLERKVLLLEKELKDIREEYSIVLINLTSKVAALESKN